MNHKFISANNLSRFLTLFIGRKIYSGSKYGVFFLEIACFSGVFNHQTVTAQQFVNIQ
jgi:hypothetical protein